MHANVMMKRFVSFDMSQLRKTVEKWKNEKPLYSGHLYIANTFFWSRWCPL